MANIIKIKICCFSQLHYCSQGKVFTAGQIVSTEKNRV